ncbi:MAG: multidrug resistance efflux transporter family protein [Clostridiales bacterium]|nr:multidrug resistance efflux transporter family protein [Candidatus Blautia equi]
MKKSLFLGILGSFFFAFTFVLNRSMNLAGGYWMWGAVLRYLFTLPLMFLLLIKGEKFKPVLSDIKANPGAWLLWSTVGFGLFYAPLTMASTFAESWFTASVWQFTIVAGILLTPVFGKKIPVKNLLLSCLILAGIFVMQIPEIAKSHQTSIVLPLLMIMIAAFSYPLGNRKMMQVCADQFTAIQRVFGMTLCSIPFWLLCGVFAYSKAGLPSGGQTLQSFLVALFSGVIATVLFFGATDMVKDNARQLAVIEATQSGEVIFTLLLGVLVLHDNMPPVTSFIGIILIVTGMILNSLASS